MENDKKKDTQTKVFVGEEFEEEIYEKEETENLYDLVLPPGMPHKIIIEAMDKFNLEATKRPCALKTIEVEKENLLVLRGKLDDVNNAHDYIYQKLSEKYNYKKTKVS